ncbi:MAG TPA: nucleotidyltransferase family protein [Terriglobales bacterium]|nr:nucleotidyltransferase family protein [Terriglobales bacterium]
MARAPSFCGVILAAGESSRMGRNKALLPWREGTFLSIAIQTLTVHTDLVIVVGGRNADELRPVVYANGGFLAVNPAPERGQFSSLQVGVQEVLNRGRDAAIVALVDRPPARSATVGFLRQTFLDRLPQEIWAVVPEYGGRHGHPIVVGREMISTFLEAPPTANARDIEHAHQEQIVYVPVDDPLVAVNIDTPEQYAELVNSMGSAIR